MIGSRDVRLALWLVTLLRSVQEFSGWMGGLQILRIYELRKDGLCRTARVSKGETLLKVLVSALLQFWNPFFWRSLREVHPPSLSILEPHKVLIIISRYEPRNSICHWYRYVFVCKHSWQSADVEILMFNVHALRLYQMSVLGCDMLLLGDNCGNFSMTSQSGYSVYKNFSDQEIRDNLSMKINVRHVQMWILANQTCGQFTSKKSARNFCCEENIFGKETVRTSQRFVPDFSEHLWQVIDIFSAGSTLKYVS